MTTRWTIDADKAERGDVHSAIAQAKEGGYESKRRAIDALKVELKARHRVRMRALRHLLERTTA